MKEPLRKERVVKSYEFVGEGSASGTKFLQHVRDCAAIVIRFVGLAILQIGG